MIRFEDILQNISQNSASPFSNQTMDFYCFVLHLKTFWDKIYDKPVEVYCKISKGENSKENWNYSR